MPHKGRVALYLSWLLIMQWSIVSAADTMDIFIRKVPDNGLIATPINLTMMALVTDVKHPVSKSLRLFSEGGKRLPAQFVPAWDYHPQRQNSGTLLMKLPPGYNKWLKLSFSGSQLGASLPEWQGIVETDACVITHAGDKQGGFPSRIRWKKTGKVFENYLWQDRVFQRGEGSSLLAHDPEGDVALVSDGPLAKVVRVRARYCNGQGKQPDTKPHAVYDWYYFNGTPLVWVRAHVMQANIRAWDELHFLELNFRDRGFKQWAGGEPFRQGTFQADRKSMRHTRWGGLVDGTDRIAVLRGGTVLHYDGGTQGGTYLHAHGNKAWQGWREPTADFSAWLWLGSSSESVSSLSQAAKDLPFGGAVISPDIFVPLHEDEWRPTFPGKERIRLDAGDLRLLLINNGQGVTLNGLYDRISRRELLSGRSGPLFSVTLRHGARGETVMLNSDEGWGKIAITRNDKGLTLRWSKPQGVKDLSLCVNAELVCDAASHAFRWSLSATDRGGQWAVRQVEFPKLDLADPGEDSCLFYPNGPGVVARDAWVEPFHFQGRYPGGWVTMPFFAAYRWLNKQMEGWQPGFFLPNGSYRGLYVAMHDPCASTKEMQLTGDLDWGTISASFTHPAEDMHKPGNKFELSGRAVWRLLKGDWYDAARIYRDWAVKEARWYPDLGPDGRKDTPLWMKELPVWALTGGPPSACVDQVKAFAKYLGVPVGFHWYNWHEIPFDNDYPHYFPTRKGFREGVKALQEAGVYVMPYINGRLWDTHDKGAEVGEFERIARPAATKNEQGEPYTETYGSKEKDGSPVRLAVMCPKTALWQDKVREIVLWLMKEEGVNGVYIDQIAAAVPKLCFDKSHGHPLGGGHWWIDGYETMLTRIRKDMPPGCMLTTECTAEPYARWVDGLLSWDWQYDGQVPAFSAVYGGALQLFGRAYGAGPTADLALRQKVGQQLVFGEQLGWLNPNILNRKESAAFLRRAARLRWRFRRYFHAGEMARPPELPNHWEKVKGDWQWRGERWVETLTVLTGAWRLPREKRLAVFFVNVTDKPQEVWFQYNEQGYEAMPNGCLVIPHTEEGAGQPFLLETTKPRSLRLPPREMVVWEITAPKVETPNKQEN